MKDLINTFYRNHSLVYKILLFLGAIFLIVYLFPKSGKFKYNFEKGKPWQSENLYAPFNFAIKKSDAQIDLEKQTIIDNSILYFNLDDLVKNRVHIAFQTEFNTVFSDTIPKKELKKLRVVGNDIINGLYVNGVLSESLNYSKERNSIILSGRVEKQKTQFSNIVQQEQLKNIINVALLNENLNSYANSFTSLFFDIVEPNLIFDKTFSDKVLQEEMIREGLEQVAQFTWEKAVHEHIKVFKIVLNKESG